MTTQETWTYNVRLTLSTEHGELPTIREIENLVETQMSGNLDEETGLRCIAVQLTNCFCEWEETIEDRYGNERYYACSEFVEHGETLCSKHLAGEY